MVGKRCGKRSSPVASSQRWSVPCSAIRAAMARLTTSRGASSSTNRSPAASRSRAPCPRRASDSSGRGMAGWCRAVGWNWTNSTSAVGTPARRAMATPSPVDSCGLVVTAKSWPAPPVANTTWVARTSTAGPVRGQRGHPDAAPVLDQEIQGEPALQHRTRAWRRWHRPGPVRPRPPWPHRRRGPPGAGSAHPRGPGPGPGGLAVELHPQGDQLMDPGRPLVDQDADGLLVAEPGAGGQGVGQMQVGRVLVAAEHGGHAALGPAGGGLGEDALGQHAQRGRRPPGRRQSGQPDGGREAGHPAAQDQDVERSGPDRVVHAGSVRANWASRRADASSITRLRPSTCTTLGVYVASSSRSYSA